MCRGQKYFSPLLEPEKGTSLPFYSLHAYIEALTENLNVMNRSTLWPHEVIYIGHYDLMVTPQSNFKEKVTGHL